MTGSAQKQIGWWLLTGVVMIYFQIILGGITRLTGSGLSITKWEIVTGTVPPLNADDWSREFDKYKATPQYHKLNKGMTLGEFKFIYFWEYLHRLWARLMGFVFAIPFAVFLLQKKLSAALIRKLLVLIVLAAVAAAFGWLMVQSGLVDRPWVDAYRLMLHLSLALVTFGYCLWLCLSEFFSQRDFVYNRSLRKFAWALLGLLSFQLVLGGLMSGMRAGLLYPTFPLMNGRIIPQVLLSISNWTPVAFLHYDTNIFAPALIQFTHRLTAYVLTVLVVIFFFRIRKAGANHILQAGGRLLLLVTIAQVALGILTVLHFRGEVPVTLGVLHQAVAIVLLSTMLFVVFLLRKSSPADYADER
ncbi:MAG TPA: COX15/CtaA family protein [Chitinophagales bacterium]|nr:COX15/CtaA family protein [Chitinophagales bacterium]